LEGDDRRPVVQGVSVTDDRPLSIVMIDSHAEIERGGAIQCARLAAALAERGHAVTCVFDAAKGKDERQGAEWQRLARAGVRIERRPLKSLAAMRHFRRTLDEWAPDIVHTHKNRALYFLAGACLGRRRFGWAANRGTVYSLRREPIALWIHRHWVDRMIAVADAVREQLIRDGIKPANVRTIYGSFDVERFDPRTSGAAMRRAWHVPEGAPLVGIAASFGSRKKGQDDFLRAARLIIQRHPDAYFVLAGDGPSERYRELAEALGLADRARFPGFVSDMPAALAAMDVVVCASTRGEGLTGSLREALAMARPVVSTDVAGNRELLRDGETGLLVPISQPQALADAVSSLLSGRARAASLGAAGRSLVLDFCTDDSRARQVEEVYRELLNARA
jgi:glycosyltransferase involved in cell wall biosynthesis